MCSSSNFPAVGCKYVFGGLRAHGAGGRLSWLGRARLRGQGLGASARRVIAVEGPSWRRDSLEVLGLCGKGGDKAEIDAARHEVIGFQLEQYAMACFTIADRVLEGDERVAR